MSSSNHDISTGFYDAFVRKDVASFDKYYHQNLKFTDPVFGDLDQSETIAMWTMLFEASDDLEVTYQLISSENDMVKVEWRAVYSFGKNRRKVMNRITAELTITDGLIIRHRDNFNLHNWARQALGTSGLLLGWTTYFRNKLQKQTRSRLSKYMAKSN